MPNRRPLGAPDCKFFIVCCQIFTIHNKLESAEPFMEVVCKELDPIGELLRVWHHPELVQFNHKQEK